MVPSPGLARTRSLLCAQAATSRGRPVAEPLDSSSCKTGLGQWRGSVVAEHEGPVKGTTIHRCWKWGKGQRWLFCSKSACNVSEAWQPRLDKGPSEPPVVQSSVRSPPESGLHLECLVQSSARGLSGQVPRRGFPQVGSWGGHRSPPQQLARPGTIRHAGAWRIQLEDSCSYRSSLRSR